MRWGQPTGWAGARAFTRAARQRDHALLAQLRVHPRAGDGARTDGHATEDWKTDEKTGHSLYAPPGVRRLLPLPHQVAVFPRGASVEVVAAFAMRPDSLPPSPTLNAGWG